MGYEDWTGDHARDDGSACKRDALRRADLGLVRRIARCIADNRGINRTQLASRCRMKYTSCISYLDFMVAMGMVTVHGRIGLTDHGYRVLGRITP
ncbi:MAG: hypothetical protein MPI95_04915 [Nitrosopumilus sp.]|nr:hypothetical protein [Nitrosopumilus sp.]CAI9830625.1 hypothetical protein IBTHAUMO2_1010006 [Nitrosopumilaceae archaeon]MDA7943539.1 hypothetical protein [Nitrosopumilus sp.]MDA7953100.1 hypothetical protein [Nitrosopumilus sp.]MDA7958416.1 hypothetical protein [Nitrosopumilus sp.]